MPASILVTGPTLLAVSDTVLYANPRWMVKQTFSSGPASSPSSEVATSLLVSVAADSHVP